MTELAIRLKEAREEKGMSLDELQAATKIQKRYLTALEEGNYDVIPGNFYVRAFIKQYAEAVGLDSDQLFEEYKKDIPNTYHDDVSEKISGLAMQRELPKSLQRRRNGFRPSLSSSVSLSSSRSFMRLFSSE